MPTSRAACTISVVSDRPESEARRELWDPIEQAWPAFSSDPRPEFIAVDELPSREENLPGLAAIIDLDGSENDAVSALHEKIWNQSIPALFIFRTPRPTDTALNGRGVMVMTPDTPAVALAATLAAVAERQRSYDTLAHELQIAQRFQSGLTGVMDKLHDELRLAAIVQKELLPKNFPALPNIDFQVFFRSAGYVSGDTYDVQQLDDHHIGFFIADAVGHGVPAALMTMIINRGIRMKTIFGDHYTIHPPGEVLAGLNRELIRHHAEAPRFASAIYGVIDSRDRTVILAGAGHPPPLIFGPDGEPQTVETEGSLLGVFADDEFTETRLTLDNDHMLVLYSDGFETAFPEQNADSYLRRLPNRRYLQRFSELAQISWRERDVVSALTIFTDEVNAQAGSLHQLDDLTAMILTPTPDVAIDSLFAGIESDRRTATRSQAA